MVNWRRVILPEGRRPGPSPGIYHYRIERPDRHSRVHLRVEKDGAALLLLDATVAVRLNETATGIAKAVLERKRLDDVVREMRARYRSVSRDRITGDYEKIKRILFPPEDAEDLCPWRHLDSTEAEPFSTGVSAPYRADLALTYRCQNECPHCYVEREREMPSLSEEEWRQVLDRLWNATVPHVCFTGGEATLCPFLVSLVEHAEDLGQITGLLTNGRRLADREYCRELTGAGLDHVQITVESCDPDVHNKMVGAKGHAETIQGLKNMIAEDIYVVTNTTLTKLNLPRIQETVEFLRGLGVRAFACNSLIHAGGGKSSDMELSLQELEDALPLIAEQVRSAGMRFIWYTPTPYCRLNPTELDLGFKRCTAAEYNVCVEPNGDVLPCQSCYQVGGNMLRQRWDAIWNGEVFRDIRERLSVPDECRECPDFAVCGSGCPLSRDHGVVLCQDWASEG